MTDTLTLTGEYASDNDFKATLRALTDLAKDQSRPRWPWTNYGRDKIWLVGSLGSEPRLAQSETGSMRLFFRRLGEAAAPWGGDWGPAPTLLPTPWHCLTTEGKITANLVSAIHLVDLAIAGDGLDWPPGPCRPSFRVRRRGQPSVSFGICRVAVLGGSSHQLTLSQSSNSRL
jgi:hypothetical protein